MTEGQRKVEILMNWRCNQRCIFCSVGHKILNDGDARTWNEIKKDLEFAAKENAGIVSFSGGEPTMRKDLPRAAQLAKKMGFETIEVQTNGCMLKYREYVELLAESGVNRVLVSIHAPNAELEDFLTQTNGSFEAKMRGLENLEKMGIEKRTSTVICRYNFRVLPEIAALLLKFSKNTKSNHLNFAIPDGFAKEHFNEMMPSISEAAPYIEKACDLLLEGGGKPFLHNLYPCILPKHPSLMSELSKAETILIGPNFKADLKKTRFKYREKGLECKNCKYFLLCPGPFTEYTKARGFEEFKPVEGKYIEENGFRLQGY
ncbi:MAG: radical SAM protein [Candidatus Diapherotrites archaeon]